MELAPSAEPNAPGCRVTFKDYSFFVPTDSAGASARVEGEVTLKRVRAAQVRHYEGEGASFASKHEDGSADEVRLVATGSNYGADAAPAAACFERPHVVRDAARRAELWRPRATASGK